MERGVVRNEKKLSSTQWLLPLGFLLTVVFALGVALAALEEEPKWGRLREAMVASQIAYAMDGREQVRDRRVLDAMRRIPRHEFVPAEQLSRAYADQPLPIGLGQTISQPYIVAKMTELLGVKPEHRVLEIGTGSGYQAAVLSPLAREVYTIEIFEELATKARERLARLGYENVTVRHADGYWGWPERAPFDAIIVTAAAGHIPPPLLAQLKPGGRMVIPVGNVFQVQNLLLVEKGKSDTDLKVRSIMPVLFVPLLGGPDAKRN